jgi:hypothetical protein
VRRLTVVATATTTEVIFLLARMFVVCCRMVNTSCRCRLELREMPARRVSGDCR